ncbi:MAG: single-stranded-DNA-specific exonuclease RecJ [Bacteroidota bacterium]|nr:single-stranded-DNA-specific exonuclease RecJ [Bacteroidota bacterium]
MFLENNIWEYKKVDQQSVVELKSQLNIQEELAQMLVNRGVQTFSQAEQFFRPSEKDFLNPFKMLGMYKAVERIKEAIANKENILIYGDYDVDGTCSVAMMKHFLETLSTHVFTYQPHREKEGYGLSMTAVDWLLKEEISLVITLDCGIKDINAAKKLKQKNIDLIICDHHNPAEILPDAFVILNPKQVDCNYNFKELCGCGIGLKLIQGYLNHYKATYDISCAYQLAAIATTADVVPLIGENRLIVYLGLLSINTNPISSVKKIWSTYPSLVSFNSADLVFKIAPRINAAGRLAHAKIAVEFLLSADGDGKSVFSDIESLNNERKSLDEDITNEALFQLSKTPATRFTNVVYSPDWHKGVIGIVASRIIEEFYKPTIVFSGDGDLITGSARSVKDFDIYEILNQLNHYFTRFGGHKYAAGLTMKREILDDFSKDFEKLVADNMSKEVRQKKISIDVDLTLEKLFQNLNKNGVPKLIRIIKQMEPFGPSNPRPVFCFKKLYFKAPPRIVGRKHIKFLFTDFQQAKHIGGIWFNSAEKLQKINQLNKADVVGSVVENYYNNQMSLQLNIKDVKPS